LPALSDIVTVLKSASEPTRLRMIALLAAGELSVKDICDILGQSQPRVSRHLKLLADAGLAERHAEGAWAYYRLAHAGPVAALIPHLLKLIDRADPVVAGDAARLGDVRRAHADLASSYFAEVAESWDRQRGLHVAERDIEAAILRLATAEPLSTVLDLGTGTGRMLELLADRYREGIGIDSSREMTAVARAKLAAAQISHAQIRLGDIGQPIELAPPADLVILHQVLHYFDDPGLVLAQAAGRCAPGGRIMVIDFAPHALEFLRIEHAHRRLGIGKEQMTTWARSAGLKVVHTEQFDKPDRPDGLTVCLWVLRPAGKGNGHDQ